MEIDFGAIGAQAKEMIDSSNSGATITSQEPLAPPVPSAATTQLQPQSTTPPISGSVAPSIESPANEKLFELDLGNGKVEKLTETQLKDAYSNGLRQQDYTRKTQELSRQRAEVEAVYGQLQAIQRELQQRQQVPQQQFQPQYQQPQVPLDPSQPMTIGQAQLLAQALAARVDEVEQGVGQRTTAAQQAAQSYVEDRLAVMNYSEAINGTLGEIYQSSPVLKALPEIEDIIRFRVAQLEPESLEQTQAAFKSVAAELARNIESPFVARQQQQVAQRQALTTNGIEPPGGAVPQAPQTDYRNKDGRGLDWDRLRNAALDLTRQQ